MFWLNPDSSPFTKSVPMSSPFTFFRRHQHVTMVGVVILSMVAFTIGDLMTQQSNQFVALGVLLGGGLMAFLGIRQGKWVSYGISGAVVGGLLGWIVPEFTSSPTGFYQSSEVGEFDDERIRELLRGRSIANTMLAQGFGSVYGPGLERFAPQFGFGYPSVEEEMMFGEILRAEADRMQVVVTDPMVSDYINETLDGRLSKSAFTEIRNSLQFAGGSVSDEDIFAAFRGELKAMLAFRLLSPGAAAANPGPGAMYDLYRRMQVRQRMNLVQLDVDAFLGEVDAPGDDEINAAFEEHKTQYPGANGPGSLGFRQFNKVALAYLQLDYDALEESVPVPAAEEIQTFYDENKEIYRLPDDLAPETPMSEEPAPEIPAEIPETPGQPEAQPAPETPDDAPPENAPPENAPAEESAPQDSPAEGSESAAPADSDKPAAEANQECDPFRSLSDEPAADEPAGEEPAVDEPAADETAADASAPVDEPSPESAPDTEAAPATSDEPPPLTIPAAADASAADEPLVPIITEARYRELDETLQAEIRDQLHEKRIREAVTQRMDEVMAEVRKLERARSSARAELTLGTPGLTSEQILAGLSENSNEMLEGLQELGERLGFTFAHTPLLNAQDLSSDDVTPIGTAQDFTTGRTVVQDAFSLFPDEQDPFADTNLFDSQRAMKNQFDLSADESHFVWWITQFAPAHIPELDDPGIRDEVILELKRQRARELAQKRGEELAELIRKGLATEAEEQPTVSELLQEQTVLNSAGSATVVVRGTQLFSWFEEELTPQMSFQQQASLRLSTIYFADGAGEPVRFAGNEFMKAAFGDLGDGEVGVIPDEMRRSYYVAHISDRIADEPVMRQMFLQAGGAPGGFQGGLPQLVSAEVRQPAMLEWTKSLWTRYGIVPGAE